MEAVKINSRNSLTFIQRNEKRGMFMFINIYLIIGMGSLVLTIFWLLSHLNISDKIIYFCIPGFILEISSGIIYFIGYQYFNPVKKQKLHTNLLIRRSSLPKLF